MNINDLTIGEAKELFSLFGNSQKLNSAKGLNKFIGKFVIIRTYSAGVHCGILEEKDGEEVILKDARRMYYWKNLENGISLSDIAVDGIHKDSKLCAPVDIWLQAIEIIPCSEKAIKTIKKQPVYEA